MLKYTSRWQGLVLAFGIVLLPLRAYAEYESVAHGVANYNGVGECGCVDDKGKDCSDSSWFTTFASTFDSNMSSMGYDQTEKWTNKGVDPRDIVDSSRESYGKDHIDPSGTDFADAILISSHGNHRCDGDYRSAFSMGEQHSGQTCWPQTDDHIEWGDRDADVAILFGCETVHECVWDNNGYAPMDQHPFSTLMGFHGTMWLNSDANGRLDDYLEDTKFNGIGELWVDYLTDLKFWSWENPDQCATAVIWGASSGHCDTMYENGGFMDFKNTASHTLTTFYYWDDCDPEHGAKL